MFSFGTIVEYLELSTIINTWFNDNSNTFRVIQAAFDLRSSLGDGQLIR
jgi:hypothetical protein